MNRISPPDPPRRLGGLDTICSLTAAAIVVAASTALISCATGALPGLTTVIPQAFGAELPACAHQSPGRSPSYGIAAQKAGFHQAPHVDCIPQPQPKEEKK
jgi:hypothetical protein